jgi:hypothetical protein
MLSPFTHNSFGMEPAGWIRDQDWELLSQVNLGEIELMIEGYPELLLERPSGQFVDLEVEADGFESFAGGLVSLCFLEVWSVSLVAVSPLGDVKASGSEESQGSGGVFTGEGFGLRSFVDGLSEAMLSVESPNSLEMGLGGPRGFHLVREENHIWLEDLWGQLA